MLFLQGETVANCNPGLGDKQGFLKGLMGKVAELDLFLEVP